jgi:hypothetical protein
VSCPGHILHTIRSGRSDTQSTAPLESRWANGARYCHPGYTGAFVLELDGNNVEAVRPTTVASARSSRSRSPRIRTFWLPTRRDLDWRRQEALMAKRLRCYLRSHRWVEKVQAGQRYYECRDCSKDRDPTRTGLPILWFWDRKPR